MVCRGLGCFGREVDYDQARSAEEFDSTRPDRLLRLHSAGPLHHSRFYKGIFDHYQGSGAIAAKTGSQPEPLTVIGQSRMEPTASSALARMRSSPGSDPAPPARTPRSSAPRVSETLFETTAL